MDKQRLKKIVGYAAFAAFCLILSLYATFPADALGQRLAKEVNARGGGAWSVSFEHVSLYRLTGLYAEGVKVRHLGDKPFEVQLDAAWGRLQLLPLLTLRVAAVVGFELGEGEFEAQVVRGRSGDLGLDMVIDDLNLASPPLAAAVGMPIEGVVSGEWEGNLAKNPVHSSGRGGVAITAAQLGPGAVSGFSFPKVGLGDLAFQVAINGGNLEIASSTKTPGDIAAKVYGTAALREQMRMSSLDACVQFKADEQFLAKNPKVKTALQLAEVQLRRDNEGFLHVPLAGTLASPRLRTGLCKGRPPSLAKADKGS